VVRRPHDQNRRHSPREHFRLCGSLEHLMIPMRDPIRAPPARRHADAALGRISRVRAGRL
jgi:hypothetical protein